MEKHLGIHTPICFPEVTFLCPKVIGREEIVEILYPVREE